MTMFGVDASETDGMWTIEVRGEVDSSSAADLRSAIRRAVGTGPVVIDLRAVPFMDSAGLAALICGVRGIKVAGGSVTLCVRKGAVLRLLTVTGFDRVVPMVRSLAEVRIQSPQQALAAS